MVARPLDIHKGDVAIEVSRHVIAAHHCVDLSVDGNLIQQIALVEQGAQMHPVGLDVAHDVVGITLLLEGGVDAGITQRRAHVAVETQVAGRGVQLAVEFHVAAASDDVTCLGRHPGNEGRQIGQLARGGIHLDAVQIQRAIAALVWQHQVSAHVQGQCAVA